MLLRVRNVNWALPLGISLLRDRGVLEESRVGKVLRHPGPVVTSYSNPAERVMFSAVRDANPFFHLMEALWMLAGRNDVEFVARYAARMAEFSDNGLALNGAYGFRWRNHFGWDQILATVAELRANPASRRVVMTMWDPAEDVGDFALATDGSKDVPCNTHIYFTMCAGKLDMTVCCRSNDVVWGAYGANAVHMSMLQELVAGMLGVPMGMYYQLSNNFHLYVERPDVERLMKAPQDDLVSAAYEYKYVEPVPLVTAPDSILSDIEMFVSDPLDDRLYTNEFLNNVARPMALAHHAHKLGDTLCAMEELAHSDNVDWHHAGYEWLARRLKPAPKTEETR